MAEDAVHIDVPEGCCGMGTKGENGLLQAEIDRIDQVAKVRSLAMAERLYRTTLADSSFTTSSLPYLAAHFQRNSLWRTPDFSAPLAWWQLYRKRVAERADNYWGREVLRLIDEYVAHAYQDGRYVEGSCVPVFIDPPGPYGQPDDDVLGFLASMARAKGGSAYVAMLDAGIRLLASRILQDPVAAASVTTAAAEWKVAFP